MGKKGNITSVAALAAGVIFLVLAGAVFATTTWRSMPSMAKTASLLLLAGLFFGASEAAYHYFQIHRTAGAFHALGCIFLFLTVAAAGYFKLLGPAFLGDGGGWRVCSLGSIAMSAAMFLGIRRFSNAFYVHLCYWSITVNAALLMKALGFSGTAYINGMAAYASGLVLVCMARRRRVGTFAQINFLLFGLQLMFSCVAEYGLLMLGGFWEGSGVGNWRIVSNLLAMMIVAGTSALYARSEKKAWAKAGFQAVVAGIIHYGVMAAVRQTGSSQYLDLAFLIMAALTALFFFMGRRLLAGLRCRMGDGVLGFVQLGDTAFLAMLALFLEKQLSLQLEVIAALILVILVLGEWGNDYLPVRGAIPLAFWYMAVPVSMILNCQVPMTPARHLTEWVVLGCMAGLMAWDSWKKDVFGPMLLAISLFMVAEARIIGCRELETTWLILAGSYAFRFTSIGRYKKASIMTSTLLFSEAFLRQPWIAWPALLETEARMLPVAGSLYVMGRIWKGSQGIHRVQAAGYLGCLFLLSWDAIHTGLLVDALILEGICLALFLAAHMAGNRRWIRISGSFLIGIAIYATRGFWLSIAWWIYLMAAGTGLILFAAVRERKRNQE